MSGDVLAAEAEIIRWFDAHACSEHFLVVLPEALGGVGVGGGRRGVSDARRRHDTGCLACRIDIGERFKLSAVSIQVSLILGLDLVGRIGL